MEKSHPHPYGSTVIPPAGATPSDQTQPQHTPATIAAAYGATGVPTSTPLQAPQVPSPQVVVPDALRQVYAGIHVRSAAGVEPPAFVKGIAAGLAKIIDAVVDRVAAKVRADATADFARALDSLTQERIQTAEAEHRRTILQLFSSALAATVPGRFHVDIGWYGYHSCTVYTQAEYETSKLSYHLRPQELGTIVRISPIPNEPYIIDARSKTLAEAVAYFAGRQ